MDLARGFAGHVYLPGHDASGSTALRIISTTCRIRVEDNMRR
jgi:hypothetical protein